MPDACLRVVHALCVVFGLPPTKSTVTFPLGSGKKPETRVSWYESGAALLDFRKLREFSPDMLPDARRLELAKVLVR